MRAVRAHIFRMRPDAISKNSQVSLVPNERARKQVNKSAQVDTLASQAMKDVASCEKLGGAANER